MPNIPGPTISLSHKPTPITHLSRLSQQYDGEFYIKRDDMTGGIEQGNKIRKLEYLLADAAKQNADAIITTGGLQSNHCRATATAARQLGMKPYLLLRGTKPAVYPDVISSNLRSPDERYSL
jgi:D-cysteine desulfhydrase